VVTTPAQVRAADLQLGPRLRDARQRQGLTIDQLAAATGLTKGFLSRMERNIASPSVASLVLVCEALSLPVGALFAAPRTDLIRAGEAEQIMLSGRHVDERLLTPRGQSRLQVIRSVIEPGGGGDDELYTLNSEVEVLHVLKGELEVRFPGRTERLAVGDTLTFSGREPHTWRNPSAKRPATVLWVITPAPWVAS
jgi:transcriptional regulator with XRE-family HTH domain